VAALSATEESYFTLISCAELAEPPEREVVFAFGTLDLDRGHCFYFIIFIVNDSDLVFRTLFLARHAFSGLDIPDIPALATFELAA
jgi:hypothetical protein